MRPQRLVTAAVVGTLTLATTAVGTAAAQGNAPGFALEDRLIVFAVSLLVGGLALHVGATFVAGSSTYGEAVLTALLGAVVWALLDPIPVLGTVLAAVAWVVVIKWRFPVGWLRAVLLGVAAWAVAVVVLAALALLGVGSLEALGVPGT